MSPHFEIVMDKDQLNQKLLLLSQPHLPTALRDLQNSDALLAMLDYTCIGVCLLQRFPRTNVYEVLNWSIDPAHRGQGYGKKLLLHAMDFARLQGGRYLELGCGNGQIALLATFQRMGFRLAGVWSDYYTDRASFPPATDGIRNLDMIRLKLNLSTLTNE